MTSLDTLSCSCTTRADARCLCGCQSVAASKPSTTAACPSTCGCGCQEPGGECQCAAPVAAH